MGRQIPKWTLIKVGIVDRDPELRLGTARESGKPMDNPTTDESRENETSRGEGYRNPQGLTQTLPQDQGHIRTSTLTWTQRPPPSAPSLLQLWLPPLRADAFHPGLHSSNDSSSPCALPHRLSTQPFLSLPVPARSPGPCRPRISLQRSRAAAPQHLTVSCVRWSQVFSSPQLSYL